MTEHVKPILKRYLKKLIQDLKRDRASSSVEEKRFMAWLVKNYKSAKTKEIQEAWKRRIEYELEDKKEKEPYYDEIITYLIQHYNEKFRD